MTNHPATMPAALATGQAFRPRWVATTQTTRPDGSRPPALIYRYEKKIKKNAPKIWKNEKCALYLQCLKCNAVRKAAAKSGIFFAIVIKSITTSGAVFEKSRTASITAETPRKVVFYLIV